MSNELRDAFAQRKIHALFFTMVAQEFRELVLELVGEQDALSRNHAQVPIYKTVMEWPAEGLRLGGYDARMLAAILTVASAGQIGELAMMRHAILTHLSAKAIWNIIRARVGKERRVFPCSAGRAPVPEFPSPAAFLGFDTYTILEPRAEEMPVAFFVSDDPL